LGWLLENKGAVRCFERVEKQLQVKDIQEEEGLAAIS
jgi:hypothetical protein